MINIPIKNGSIDSEEGIEVGDEYLGIMNLARGRCIPFSTAYDNSDHPGFKPEFEAFVEGYMEWKKQNGYIDFTDMLERFVAYAAQSKLPEFDAKVLLVDEAQDLSTLQCQVINILARTLDRIYIAGDDDQAIYVWGGADPAGMTDFQDRYGADHTVLGQSYRVPKLVQELALDVITRVDSRVAKEYAPRAEVGTVERYSYIDSLPFKHGEETLVLCRTGAQKKEVEKHFVEQNIPYLMDGGKPGKYQSKAAKAIKAFNKLTRGEGITPQEQEALASGVQRQYRDDVMNRNFPALLKRGYMQVIDIPRWDYDFYKNADLDLNPTIKVSSIHGAKGREADRVVLHTGMTERTLAGMDRDPDAEHRVFYVGVTRAKHRLDILHGHQGYDL